MKKLFLIMLGAMLTLPAAARDFTYAYEGQTLAYTVIDEDAKTCMTKQGDYVNPGNAVEGELTIPAIAKDGDIEYSVTAVGFSSFRHCTGVTSVLLPQSVSSIGDEAFIGCSNLTSIDIPSTVSKIGDSVFEECISLESATIPNSVTSIGIAAFRSSGLKAIEIPNSVTIICDNAFDGCYGLTQVTIPGSVTTLGFGAFMWCRNMVSVVIPGSLTEIYLSVFLGCSALQEVYYGAATPIEGSNNIFNDSVYDNATLFVPEEAVEKCKDIDPWKSFAKIKAYDFPDGIADALVDTNKPCELFSLSGAKVDNSADGLAPGVYIACQGNAVKKIAIR
ncbi:MAG: leucine-rich repeat domain-containing protein [Muribaculaceae bacterium]|nr:leucine-rich repeat domain-containing protein [Muribaculaceae bacterium]